jgi:serine/threonine protein phosphatase PrpC
MDQSVCPLQVATLTNVGRVRRFNEDTLAADMELGMALVADGMGRNRAGEVASRMARDIVVAGLRATRGAHPGDASRAIVDVLEQANREIYKAAQDEPGYRGMASSLALLLFRGQRVAMAHVGDSRVYRLRAGRLTLLTRDDSLLSDQIEMGLIAAEDAGASRNRHLVTQALGAQEQIVPRYREEELQQGDIYLVCSDGLNDMVDDADIELIVDSLQANLPLAAKHLVQFANDLGGLDNVSVVLVKAEAAVPLAHAAGPLGRLLGWLRRH